MKFGRKKYQASKSIGKALLLIVFMSLAMTTAGQSKTALEKGTPEYIDSLSTRVKQLETQLPLLKKRRDPSLYYLIKDLEYTLFAKTVEEWIYKEQHDQAKGFVEDRLKKAKLKQDKQSITFYDQYKDRINREIKFLKMRYQALFEKEKTFRKHYEKMVKDESLESYKNSERMVQLAIKFASENNLTNTIQYLSNYLEITQSIIYSMESPYDLVNLTRSDKEFDDLFLPMLGSDSLKILEEASELVDYCYYYAANTKSLLDTVYFSKKRKVLNSAITEQLDMMENPDARVASLTNRVIFAKKDSINPKGVYKWGEYIVVINHFIPKSGFQNVKKGEAIIHADQTLIEYIEENDLGRIKEGSKFGYTYLIPFEPGNVEEDFLYDKRKHNWQYMACYTKIVNNFYTKELLKFLPPLKFYDIENGIDNVNRLRSEK